MDRRLSHPLALTRNLNWAVKNHTTVRWSKRNRFRWEIFKVYVWSSCNLLHFCFSQRELKTEYELLWSDTSVRNLWFQCKIKPKIYYFNSNIEKLLLNLLFTAAKTWFLNIYFVCFFFFRKDIPSSLHY